MTVRTSVKKILPYKVFERIEPTGHLLEATLAQIRGGFPARKLKIIGVTGTDGKTTTSTLIAHMLRNSGKRVAMVTTISVDYGDGRGPRPNPTRMTTMGAAGLVRLLKKIQTSGVEWLVLETTSHALAQYRVWGVPYSIAVMTNVGHEHLDYHRTFERYRDAKKQLFTLVRRNRKGLGVGVINADDPSAALFAAAVPHPITYGMNKGDLRAVDIIATPAGSNYVAKIGDDTYHVSCQLPGTFNVYNSLAAVAVGRAAGLSKAQIEQGIASLPSVEGRMTRVDEGQNFDVIVDYAHTPESFEKLFQEIKPLVQGRLIGVFGSAGRRDEAKRAVQGHIAGQFCDIVIATEEDDRDIDGQEILEQIASGAENAGKKRDKDLFLIHDREDAVAAAIDMAKDDDVILLLGKGHEKSILSNGPKAAKRRHELQNDSDPERVIKRSYDEVLTARKALRRRILKS